MADKRNWDNICKYGLLSTTALLDLFEYQGEERAKIESQLRIKPIQITHPKHGNAHIRDQQPMRDRPEKDVYLMNCLVGITPEEWFELMNKKTFFWADCTGLGFMLGARLYYSKSHYVLTVDTRKLVDCHADKVTLSEINSGSLYGKKAPVKRSKDTFKPISLCSRMPWVKEVAVDYSVVDILDLTVSVDECISNRNRGHKIIRHIWPT